MLLYFHYIMVVDVVPTERPMTLRLSTPAFQEAALFISSIIKLPTHPAQLLLPRNAAIASRIVGEGHTLNTCSLERLPFLLSVLPNGATPLVCIISGDEIAERVCDCIVSAKNQVMHLSPSGENGSLAIDSVGREDFAKYTITALAQLSLENSSAADILETLKSGITEWKPEVLHSIERNHGTTHANELLLASFGYIFPGHKTLKPGPNRDYVTAIMASANLVARYRKRAMGDGAYSFLPPVTDVILAAPAVLRSYYTEKSALKEMRRSEPKMAEVLAALTSAVGYKFMTRVHDSSTIEDAMTPELYEMSRIMGRDIHAFNAASAMLVAASFAPVLRLPWGVNLVQRELLEIGKSVRFGNVISRRKLSTLFGRMIDKLTAHAPSEIRSYVRRHGTSHVKLIADVPLELMRIDGFPLTLRHECSRIPSTPGDLNFQECLKIGRVMLTPTDLNDVLVIRSFSAGDPIKTTLQECIEAYQSEKPWAMRVTFRDVATVEEFKAACQSFAGAVLIFDGHGSHLPDSFFGTLSIGAGKMDVWQFGYEIRMPPIVILSACDTHPSDSSHASVANGFLSQGAKTVLGTTLPVEGGKSAIHIARLLFRIETLVRPMVARFPLRWSTIVWDAQRMMFVTEALLGMRSKNFAKISEDETKRLMLESTLIMSRRRKDWVGTLVRNVAAATGKSVSATIRYLSQSCLDCDALRYVQLGNPERITLISDEFAKIGTEITRGKVQ